MKWDGRLLRRVFSSVLVLALFSGVVSAAVNETLSVQAQGQDNPQANASDLEGNFTNAPNADKDEIHVVNDNIKGESAGVYNDPVHDGALLTITQDTGPVKVEVEGREGIGAIYWVSVKSTDNGGAGGGGGGEALLWADVKDTKTPGALILKDKIGGKGESDKTDSDDNTSTVNCKVKSENGRGQVQFWLEATSGTYDWTMVQGSTAVSSGTLSSTNGYSASADDVQPGVYSLIVTKQGDGNFRRKINLNIPTTWNYMHPEMFALLSSILDSQGAVGAKLGATAKNLDAFGGMVDLVYKAYRAANEQNANASLWSLLWGGGNAVKPISATSIALLTTSKVTHLVTNSRIIKAGTWGSKGLSPGIKTALKATAKISVYIIIFDWAINAGLDTWSAFNVAQTTNTLGELSTTVSQVIETAKGKFQDLDGSFATYEDLYDTYDGKIWNAQTDPAIYLQIKNNLDVEKPQIDAAVDALNTWCDGVNTLISDGITNLMGLIHVQ